MHLYLWMQNEIIWALRWKMDKIQAKKFLCCVAMQYDLQYKYDRLFINREIVKNESDTVILLSSSKSGNLHLHLFDEKRPHFIPKE